MRLLLVSQDFPPDVGGIQTYAAELARRLALRCEAFAVVAPQRPGALDADHRFSFPVHRLPARSDLLVLAALFQLPYLAREGRFDVALHAQWPTALASLTARRLTGYPRRVAIAVHGREVLSNPWSPVGLGLGTLYDRLRRAALLHADRLLPVSRYTGGLLEARGVMPDRIVTVPNGADTERFQPLDASDLRRALRLNDQRVLLTLGRLVPRKGIDTVLRALPRVVADVPNVCYLVGGSGPDRARLERLAHDVGVADRVRFLGHVPEQDIARYYNACDLFVMPARDEPPDVEGFGLVFLEAGACGRPVIGSTAGGIPDAILDGQTGLLVPPDRPDVLASTISKVLQEPRFAERLGRGGRAYVQLHASWDRVADRVFDALATLS